VRPWPAETPIWLADRMTAQRALAALGFNAGTPDGIVGVGTRTALRAWQKARGLTADGYLSPVMVQRLRVETGAADASIAPPALAAPLAPAAPPAPAAQADPAAQAPPT
jgi:membrane-bound lytic murein transglycosylase B